MLIIALNQSLNEPLTQRTSSTSSAARRPEKTIPRTAIEGLTSQSHVMIITSKAKGVYYPTSEKQGNLISGSRRVRYIRAALVIRPKN